jgi:hypothetical protein
METMLILEQRSYDVYNVTPTQYLDGVDNVNQEGFLYTANCDRFNGLVVGNWNLYLSQVQVNNNRI